MTEPYVKRDPGDVIRSSDWNELQVKTREEMHNHTHTGYEDGLKIPREGIEANAINGDLIDPEAKVTVKSLTIAKELKVNGKAILNDVDDLYTRFVQLEKDKVNLVGDTFKGPLKLEDNLIVSGNLGLGTATPRARLDVNGSIHALPVMGSWYPNAHGPSDASLVGKVVNMVLDREVNVTDPSYFTNLGGDAGIRIEKDGYYHLEAVALVYVSPGDHGHLYIYVGGEQVDCEYAHAPTYTTWDDRHCGWKGFVKAGSVVMVRVYHHKPTSYWYHYGPTYTRLTIHKIN